LTVGQEISGWSSLVGRDLARIRIAMDGLYDLALGGTSVGAGLNTHPEFAERAGKKIAELTHMPFRSHPNKFAALSAHDELVFASGALEVIGLCNIDIGCSKLKYEYGSQWKSQRDLGAQKKRHRLVDWTERDGY